MKAGGAADRFAAIYYLVENIHVIEVATKDFAAVVKFWWNQSASVDKLRKLYRVRIEVRNGKVGTKITFG
jgi:hypothetical protein